MSDRETYVAGVIGSFEDMQQFMAQDELIKEQAAEIERLRMKVKKLEAQLRTSYGYGSDDGAPPWIK